MREGRPREYHRRTIFSMSLEADLYDAFKDIAWRERKDMNKIIQEYMIRYVAEHGAGNSQFKMDKWYEQSDFRVTPALLEANEKWDKHLADCDYKELMLFQGTFKKRLEQVKKIEAGKRMSRFNTDER